MRVEHAPSAFKPASTFHALALWLVCALPFASAPALAQVAVGSTGQATYSLPIAVAPGIAGMAPNLSLSFSDGGVNGPIGVGWSLQGVSTISRCAATRATDGVARAVDYTEADKLCLDGQRLIQTDETGNPTPTSGGNAHGIPVSTQQNDAQGPSADNTVYREFRTEKDTFARIRAYGQASGSAANGPAFFKVWTKSGQVYEYGRDTLTGDPEAAITIQGRPVVMVWAVRRISDSTGNYIDFRYVQRDVAWGSGPVAGTTPGREWNVAEIRYTGTASSAPRNKVVFNYEDRPGDAAPGFDLTEAYQLRNKNVSIQRLSRIRVVINTPATAALGFDQSNVIRTYKLAYVRSSVSGRSLVAQVTECAGAAETKCLHPASFTYTQASPLQYTLNPSFKASSLSGLKLQESSTGNYGVLTGDFNGDGRTDILRWGHNPYENLLYFSQGGGSFAAANAFDLVGQNLFRNDGCYYATVADFNGDGLSDILRVGKPGCAGVTTQLFLSLGDGRFSVVPVPASIDLTQKKFSRTVQNNAPCYEQFASGRNTPDTGARTALPTDNYGPGAQSEPPGTPPPKLTVPTTNAGGTCFNIRRTIGKRYYILDVNGDGIPDIVTTLAKDFPNWNSSYGPLPSERQICLGETNSPTPGPCTRIFLGSTSGAFNEVATNVADDSLYSDPPGTVPVSNPYWRLPDQADISGDGLQDILSSLTGRWRSNGNGNFTASPVQDTSQLCGLPIDFNGDGRSDCLRPDVAPATAQSLSLSYGAADSGPLANFNLRSTADALSGLDGNGRQSIGVVIDDFDGDGRQDILRWGPNAAETGIYLSNGEGSFRPRVTVGLEAIPRPLQAADGSTSFVLGDFLGTGTNQILHLKDNPNTSSEAAGNQIYARAGSAVPVELLATAVSSTGLQTTINNRVTLVDSAGHYISERNTAQAATGTALDVQPALYVVPSVTQDTGVGAVTTEYLYKGMKVDRARGALGFRELRQQSPAPDGINTMTTVTEFVQAFPYAGVAGVSKTYLGRLNLQGAQLLSQTTNSYCDRSSGEAPRLINTPGVAPPPCASSFILRRPYVYQTLEQGWDLATGQELPSITTISEYNNSGDPWQIYVQTRGNAVGLDQVFEKWTTNTYRADAIAGDSWILGRLERSSVRSRSPNSLPSIASGPGSSPSATAVSGAGAPPAPAAMPPGLLSAILQVLLDD